MSGIVGIINLDGAPVERQLLEQMTDFMAYRGPDAQDIWIDGHVGFGHTMLRTTIESMRERQPYSLDGQVWITADGRVDGRKDLIQKLASKGRTHLEALADPDLILHAYHTWGEGCVEHLIGDFAFAIWDGHRERLFCARDHFGVKPFYYAQVGNSLIFSNTLNSIRMHPAVSDELNELAVADFLLFDFNQELSTTTFADIQRLPPAHCFTWSDGAPRLIRYWSLPIDGHIRYRKAMDYVDQFKELLRTAVDDRLRTDRVGVSMSGGLDSTIVAATAHELLLTRSRPFGLRAYTVVYDRLIPDRERYYSGLVAKALGIPSHFLVADDYRLYERYGQPELRRSEPFHAPLAAMGVDEFKQMAGNCQVALTGEGGDNLFHSGDLLQTLPVRRLVADVGKFVLSRRRLPRLGFRTRLKDLLGSHLPEPAYPPWLNGAFAVRLDLPARWEQLNNIPWPIHPTRPKGYQSLIKPFWPYIFDCYDPGMTLVPIEVRHPFFDLRLANYLLAIPPIPWCVDKDLLRRATHGILPEPVRRRPKAPLAGDPVRELLRDRDARWVDDFDPTPELGKYVERDAVPKVFGEEDPNKAWMNLRPLSLNYWLQDWASGVYESGGGGSIMKSEGKEPAKKPYSGPQLIVYGDIREITQSKGSTGAGDGGRAGAPRKTGLP